MNGLDRHARKQVLLARIAFSRHELRRDIAQVKRAAQPAQLLHAVVGDGVGATLNRTLGRLFGAHANLSDWVGTAAAWLSRYRVAASVVSSVLPVLGGRRGLGRLLRLGAVVGAGWLGWRALNARRRQP